MDNWWEKDSQKLRFAQYQINERTRVYVGNRPDHQGTTLGFSTSIQGWINISDRLVKNYPENARTAWYPWNESGLPSLETIFATLKTLDYWINELKLSRIYIHCDGGTHRAVSLFGFYLLAYHKENAQKINDDYILELKDGWSNPLEYALSYTKENKDINLLIEKIHLAVDSSTYGISFDDFINEQIGKDKLSRYYWQRYVKQTLPLAFKNLKYDIKSFIQYNLFVIPYVRVLNWIHKKLNTKKGKELKKYGL